MGDSMDEYPVRKGKKTDFIYIHINKTAGTSVAKAIGLPRKNHMTAVQLIDQVGEAKWDRSYKFTFVRNPWDKVVSHYNYRVKTNQTNLGDGHLSFADWVKCTYGPNKDETYYNNPIMFQPQAEWLRNAQGQIDVNFIGKFESLSEDFSTIAQQIGLKNTSLPHLNKTLSTDYRDYYDEETTQIIREWFEEDLTLFDYTF